VSAADKHYPLEVCPKADQVHASLMDEYLKMAKDPKSTILKINSTSSEDYLSIWNENKLTYVGVLRDHDLTEPKSITHLEAYESGKSRRADIYKDGTRISAQFDVSDPTSGHTASTYNTKFGDAKGKAYMSVQHGEVWNLAQLSKVGDFEAKFGPSGKLTEYALRPAKTVNVTIKKCK